MASLQSARNGRAAGVWEAARASFGFLSAVLMLAGVVVGFGLPALDDALDVQIPVFEFGSEDAARSLLQTIATVTVAVAGLAFSVTVVAFTLASSQLSPRVLRTFRADRISQWTLALFLGTFIYCISVLVRLGATDEGARVPNLSITLALVLAAASFLLFAAFIAHIVSMLQPSSVIAGILDDAGQDADERFPAGAGGEPDDPARAMALAETTMQDRATVTVRADEAGFVDLLRGDRLVGAAGERGALVRQRPALGDYVVPGDPLADVWCRPEDADDLGAAVREAFELGTQRTGVQDVAFPVRQLADIALKGLSPGINDPTTAENAMDAMTALLVRFAGGRGPAPVRVDGEGRPRLVTCAPTLDDLVRLGFDQVRVFAAPYPVVSVRLLALLARIADAARESGVEHAEVDRQAALLAEGTEGEVPTAADVDGVRRAHARLHSPSVR